MSKLKIVHLVSSLKIGGAESLLCDLLRNLDKNLFDNHVVYFHFGPNISKIQSLGIPTYQIKGLFFKYDPIFFLRLLFIIKKLKPNLIHSSLWSANFVGSLIAKTLKIPIVSTLHSASNLGTDKSSYFRFFLDKYVFKFADKIITVSDDIAHNIKLQYPNINQNKIYVIKNGIDCSYVMEEGLNQKIDRQDFGLNNNHFIIGSIGRFVPVKNQQLLIEAFYLLSTQYSNVRLMLIGQGTLESFLRNKVEELNISDKVIFTSSENAYGFYTLFDCFVLSSKQEGLSIALLEAMSFGIPCIVTSNNNRHEVIEPNINGYICKFDSEDLFKKLELLYKNENLRNQLGQRANEIVSKKFNLNNMTDMYSKLYQNIK